MHDEPDAGLDGGAEVDGGADAGLDGGTEAIDDPTVTRFEFQQIAQGEGAFSTDTGGAAGVEGTISIKQGTTAIIALSVMFEHIADGTIYNYALSGTIDAPANGWSVVVNQQEPNPTPITGPGGAVALHFDVTAPLSTDATILRLLMTRAGGYRRTVAYRLVPQL